MATGKRAGSRKATRSTPTPNRATLGYAAGITLCVIAWGYLVYAAIDFGGTARNGNAGAWGLLLLAGLGAATCLFVGLMLVSRLLTSLANPDDRGDGPPAPPRAPGGRRAAR